MFIRSDWIFTTFGVPVDPEVYMTMAVSSGVGDAVEESLLSTGIVDSIFAPWNNFSNDLRNSNALQI